MSARKILLVLPFVLITGGIALAISTLVFIVFVVSGLILVIVRRLQKAGGVGTIRMVPDYLRRYCRCCDFRAFGSLPSSGQLRG
jgi:hypothetical protein